MAVLIGTAGWSLPRALQEHFPGSGSHLERYASRFPVVEINSSFHRPHRAATWARWRDSVPANFRFCVKMPKAITHIGKLREVDELVGSFLAEAAALGHKLTCVLVQLPPSLAFDRPVARQFFNHLRAGTPVSIACEPRHESWFDTEADELLKACHVARAAADPARVAAAALPGGWRGMSYYRLHGSPKIYYSAYAREFIESLAARISEEAAVDQPTWVIFDNTTLGAATGNALELAAALHDQRSETPI